MWSHNRKNLNIYYLIIDLNTIFLFSKFLINYIFSTEKIKNLYKLIRYGDFMQVRKQITGFGQASEVAADCSRQTGMTTK